MCGPFFSLMPFPAAGLQTLSHVRYTPHFAWLERDHAGPGSDSSMVTVRSMSMRGGDRSLHMTVSPSTP